MLATLISSQISEWDIQLCCYCIFLSNGAKIIGVYHTLLFIASATMSIYSINVSYFAKSCFGPIKVDIVAENCTQLLAYQKLPRTHEFEGLHQELLRLSAHFQDFKMDYVSTLIMILITHLVSIGAGILLLFGVYLRRKIFLIPW